MEGDPRLPTIDTIVAGRYRIDAALGKGGMGAVYRAEDLIVGEPVALKVLLSSDAQALERFKHELLLARRVTHPNIGRTYDMGRDGSLHFLTMELVTGDSLRGVLRGAGALSPSDIGHYLGQVASGLAAAHDARVIHRDLKPSNVLVTREGRVVVIDFGIASFAECGRPAEGTLDYMSPEQLDGAPASPAHDVYALGCVAYELATGRYPFPGESSSDRARARLDGPPLLDLLASTPALREIVAACLAPGPADRPTARDLALRFAALKSAQRPRVEVVAPPEAEPPTRPALFAAAPTLAIARFDFRGPASDLDLAAAVAEEITDVLSMTRGLRVLTTNAAADIDWTDLARWASTRTVDFVVSGKLEQAGSGALKVTVRLLEAKTGAQVHRMQLEAQPGAIGSLAMNAAMKVAEALRLELEVLVGRPSIPDEAALLFLEARQLLRNGATPVLAMQAFDRCLAAAPDFPPAIAARAVAVARAFHLGDDTFRDWSKEARLAEARALELAPLSPDTHLAIGIRALAETRFAEGLRALYRTVELAPTHALAHEIIGRVECEAGQASRGMERLELALTLDPTLRNALSQVARAHALRGRLDEFDATLARSARPGHPPTLESIILRIRAAIWFRDEARAKSVLATLREHGQGKGSMREHAYATAVDLASLAAGELPIERLREREPARLTLPFGPRLRSTMLQLTADYEAAYGNEDRALVNLELSVASGLIDIEWLQRSPALDALRHTPEFGQSEREVSRRVAALWHQSLAAAPPVIQA